jgi:hypothetical protein
MGAATGGTGGTSSVGGSGGGSALDAGSTGTGGATGADGGVSLGGDGGGAPSVAFWCASTCRNNASLMCPNADTCAANCEKEYADAVTARPQCRAPLQTLLSCAATRLPQDFHCGADGQLEVRPGVCEPEVMAVASCVFGSAPGADAGTTSWLTAGCEAICRHATTLNCTGAGTCVADCEGDAAQLIAQKPQCTSSLQALLTCAVSRPVQDWQCDADGKLLAKAGVCAAEAQAAGNCVLGP